MTVNPFGSHQAFRKRRAVCYAPHAVVMSQAVRHEFCGKWRAHVTFGHQIANVYLGARVQAEQDELSNLMRESLSGDANAYRRALKLLTPKLRASVHKALVRCGRGGEAAEDIVQETLLAIHLKRATWDPALPVEPWARAIARYKMIDFLRRKGERLHEDIADFADVVPEPGGEAGQSIAIRSMLQRLPQRDRDIVEQMTVEGASARETGERLGMNEGAVRVALHRALKSLAVLVRGET
jgi:RNA polymerase sigma-70 factor, ECF subfamily